MYEVVFYILSFRSDERLDLNQSFGRSKGHAGKMLKIIGDESK